MSSDSRRFSTFVLPSDRAARRRHRLLRDFDPGRVTVPSRDLIGATVKVLVASSTAAMDNNDVERLGLVEKPGVFFERVLRPREGAKAKTDADGMANDRRIGPRAGG